MKKFYVLLLASIFLALIITTLWPGHSFEEQLIWIQAKKELGDTVNNIEDPSIEIQSVLLDYSEDRELVLKAQLALMKYPEQAREILLLFGSELEFQEILLAYVESVIPVIHYFLTTDIKRTIKLRDNAGKFASDFKKKWWNGIENNNDETQHDFGLEQQGWYAIQSIKNGGHDFLGQFAVDDQGEVKWIQTERVTEGLTAFFTSGIRGLETRYATEQEITGDDLLWAGVDVLAAAGTLKLLRAGRQVARTGKSIGLTRTTTLFGSRLMMTGFAGRLFKYSAIAATAWVVIKHPSLISSLFAEVGQLFGIPPILAQIIGVALLAFVFLYPTLWFLKLFIRPVNMAVRFLIMTLTNLEKRLQARTSTKID